MIKNYTQSFWWDVGFLTEKQLDYAYLWFPKTQSNCLSFLGKKKCCIYSTALFKQATLAKALCQLNSVHVN